MQEILQVIDEQEKALDALYLSHKSLLGLARTQAKQLAAQSADGDEWTRMPRKDHRCKITGWTGRNINKHHAAGRIRKKTIHGSSYYSGADARKLIKEA